MDQLFRLHYIKVIWVFFVWVNPRSIEVLYTWLSRLLLICWCIIPLRFFNFLYVSLFIDFLSFFVLIFNCFDRNLFNLFFTDSASSEWPFLAICLFLFRFYLWSRLKAYWDNWRNLLLLAFRGVIDTYRGEGLIFTDAYVNTESNF